MTFHFAAGGLTPGAKVGISFGVISFILVVIIIVVVYLRCKDYKPHKRHQDDTMTSYLDFENHMFDSTFNDDLQPSFDPISLRDEDMPAP